MTTVINTFLISIAVGGGASLLMDLWNLLLKRMFGIPSLNYCLLGRWIRWMPKGTFRHATIIHTRQQPFECTIGWIAHYSIGVVFAFGLILLSSGEWLARPTLIPALIYGFATVVFPLFIMQPSLGFGIASSKTPNPLLARVKSCATHTVFGFGLYICAFIVKSVM
jgi:hypothetical protein